MVSIIIPVYNKEQTIRKCVDSILAQTCDDYEIILVNDGSQDSSLSICNYYNERYKNIVVINQVNSGVSSARNAGIEMAKGKWIMFVDPDDIVFPDLLETLLALEYTNAQVICGCLSTTYNIKNVENVGAAIGEKVSFYSGNYIFCDYYVDINGFKYATKKELFLELINEKYGGKGYRFIGIATPCIKLYDRELIIEKNIRFDNELVRMQDNLFNMEVFDKADKIVYIDESLYLYNISHKMSFRRKYEPEAAKYYDLVLQKRYDYLKDKITADVDYYNEFCAGVIEIANTILKHYFLNPSNNSIRKKTDMKEFFSRPIYHNAFKNLKVGKTRKMMRLRAFLLLFEWYDLLLGLERMVYLIKAE